MYEGWGSAPGGWQPAPQQRKRTGWIIGAAVVGVVALCVCVVSALLAPLAFSRITGRISIPGAGSLTPSVCGNAAPRDTVPTDQTGQFTVQPLYAEVLNYAKDAAKQPSSQRANLWEKDVLYPYPPMNDIFSENFGTMDQWAQTLNAKDPDAFRCVVLDMQTAHIEQKALVALQAAARQVPGPHTLAYLVPWYDLQIGGASQEQSLLIPVWENNPLNRTLAHDGSIDWTFIEFALDHEYLEVARYDRLGSVSNAYLTLLDNMVTDGMADNFAAHMTGQPLERGMDPATEAALWAKYKPTINQYANPNQEAVMLGDPANGIPDGAGYQIGDHIVTGYLTRHPNVTFNQLASMDATEILAGSGYNG
jgi:hypothetical protein